MADVRVIQGDCLDVLQGIPDASVDAVIADPPYPCIKRPYGYWTEEEWWALMRPCVRECMRVLKPTGSAVFILQPNSERVGRMRTWLWDFLAWVGREFGIVQDAYWWNPATPPTVHVHRSRGGLRPSVKTCVWVGLPGCFKNQAAVLWEPSDAAKAEDRSDRALKRNPSGLTIRRGRCVAAADERGGVTPFNLLPIPNTDSQSSAGAYGHGAGTPMPLLRWWVRYICPPGGTILDPFAGSGTTGVACLREGRSAVLIEREPAYVEIIHRRLQAERDACPLFTGQGGG
jgi:DNA modification methylase